MNFDQAKVLRLQQWRSTLDDHDFRMQNPEGHRQTLHEMSSALVIEGVIDELQRFDLNEMANAAYWHAVEELQTTPSRYCGASAYDVMRHGNTELFGKIGQSIFYAARKGDEKRGRIYLRRSQVSHLGQKVGSTGQLPEPVSHRSGRAQLTHPAPQ